MDIFNAPTREHSTVRRERTNTPLQALVTMNDTQFVEASRFLAQRAMREAGDDFDRRLDYVFVGEPRDRGTGHVVKAELVGTAATDGLHPSDHYGVLVTMRY
jgi:endonuclease/exonuclease/phosphatase family metal-dependent hydrolase